MKTCLVLQAVAASRPMTTTILTSSVASYIKAAMIAWVPLARHVAFGETLPEIDARYARVAEDITIVASDPAEPAVFPHGPNGNVKMALELAAIASFEGGFQTVVENGTCNRPDYKADGRGSCDNKHAFSDWQIHANDFAGGGLILLEDGGITAPRWAPERAAAHPEEIWTGARLIADPRGAARVALHLVRQSYKQFGSLCAFTGETTDPTRQCIGPHPKADNRHERAIAYLRQHPYTE